MENKYDSIGEEGSSEEGSGDDFSEAEDEMLETEESPASPRPGAKRTHPHQDTEHESGEPKKKVKKLGKELFRPPTAEEMNQLRETENLFHSNLFRLQIEEMLKEVSIKQKYKKKFETWFLEFKAFLEGLKKSKEIQLSDPSWLKKRGVSLPAPLLISSFKGTFHFSRPTAVTVIGSYAADCRLGPNIEIDIRVEMPQESLLRSDFKNQRYLLKRALYTARLAALLGGWDQVASTHFSLLEGDPLKPIVVITPTGKLGKHTSVRVLVVPPGDCFKLSQLGPEKANVQAKWLLGKEHKDEVDLPTPRYNRSLAVDQTMVQNEQARFEALEGQRAVSEGIMLLKVWLRQRGLDQGYGAFSGYIMSMYVLHLLKSRRLSAVMSSYQVVRNTWNCLAQSDWTEVGITLGEESPVPVQDFHLLHDVVFVDVTGFVNLCGNMSKATFLTVKNESALAVKCLDNPNINSFQVLFMTPMPFYRQYDHVICFHDGQALQGAEDRVGGTKLLLDCAGPWAAREALVGLLRQGLAQRVSLLAVQLYPAPTWGTTEDPPNARDTPLTVGLKLDPEHALSLLDKGPAANMPEAKEFREFWGDKSELRRFRDGSVCEAVVWSGMGVAQRRLVCRDVVHHLAQRHLGLNPSHLLYLADQLDSILAVSAGENGALAATKVCDALGRQLMQLEDLPLSISAVQGTAPCLRYADPFPPRPLKAPKLKGQPDFLCMRTSETKATKFVAPIPVVLTLGLSSKWPEDLEAIRRIKAAFYIKIAECLSSQCQLLAQPYPSFVDVLKEGYVFRLSVSHAREVSLLKESTTPQGQLRYKDTDQSLAVEMASSHLPKLTSTLHGLHMLHPALGPASCLAKRWVAAHMLLDPTLMPEACVEMLVASLFLSPEPYVAPVQPQPAFLRFLERLAKNPWASEPLILNFGGEIPRPEVLEIENRFSSERDSLPPLFIATPDSRSGTVWTRRSPSKQVLFRLAQLARASLTTLDSQLVSNPELDHKLVFRTPLAPFDLIVRLERRLTRREEAVDSWLEDAPEVAESSLGSERLPVVGLDLVQCFLQDLRDAYDEYALFFYDKHGGRQIGVLYKPHTLKSQEFKVSHIAGQKPKPPSKMEFNTEAFIDDIRMMGEGLVKSIEVKAVAK